MDNLWIIYRYSMDNLWIMDILWIFYGYSMDNLWIWLPYPPVMTNIAIENGYL